MGRIGRLFSILPRSRSPDQIPLLPGDRLLLWPPQVCKLTTLSAVWSQPPFSPNGIGHGILLNTEDVPICA